MTDTQQAASQDVLVAFVLGAATADVQALLGAMSEDELRDAHAALEALYPLNTQNPFWQVHELPYDVDPLDRRLERVLDRIDDRIWECEDRCL